MFVSHAHSFTKQAWLAITLAWVGGYTDIITLLSCGVVTSHVSGTTSNFGRALFGGPAGLAGLALFLLAAFFFGAAVAGVCTELGHRRRWESIYVLPMVIETLLLAAFAFALEIHGPPIHQSSIFLYAMIALASAAMGLQNATITRISSGQVRTTHVTGVLTDLGHESIGYFWRLIDQWRGPGGDRPQTVAPEIGGHSAGRRLALLASILAMFALGAGLAAFVYGHAPRMAMFPPVAFLAWLIYQDFARPIARIEASSGAGSDLALGLPSFMAVFHLRKDHARRGRVHRLPDLLAWCERLAPNVRVAILDLDEFVQLDSNAALELKAVLARLAGQGRELIISGMNREQFEKINSTGGNPIIPQNVCPDLELAIARGMCLGGAEGQYANYRRYPSS
ncbi:MAG TPA: DUF1275 family protein [Tepidisphaeraceae bacterium]|nr:DUF1275 family protein [Tepidisphaeraceae bacterium]